MFDVQSYLDLPNEPNNCIYENYRDKILINPTIWTRLLLQNRKEEMKNIHMLHNSLYDKYGEDWVDKISFIDEELRNAIRLLYIKDYPGKDLLISMQTERRELYKKRLQSSEVDNEEHNDSNIDKNSRKTEKRIPLSNR